MERARALGRADALAALLLAALVALTYANTLGGGFVYDDTKQIVQNHLIQDDRLVGRALLSDVWAFKGERNEPWSNYWRPLFTLWLIVNARLFGVADATGWHAMNILLHAGVTALAFGLARALRLRRAVAGAVALLFAVHPAHVESVAWVSGSPNMLSAATLLGALWCHVAARGRRRVHLLALLLYALSLLAKEVALLFPAVVFVAEIGAHEGTDAEGATDALESAGHEGAAGARPSRTRARRALRAAAPYGAAAALFFAARLAVLGRVEVETPFRRDPATLLATAPSVLAFYLRQIVAPHRLGPAYPLRPVDPSRIGLGNVLLPLLIVVAAAALLARIAIRASRHRDPSGAVGLSLLVVPLLPALKVDAFIPEHLVHDRYLYVPLLGALLVLVPRAARLLEARARLEPAAADRAALLVAAVAAVPLAAQTVSYNRAWTSELAMWERAVASDPTSSYSLSHYGLALHKAGRTEEAKAALDRAIAIYPNQIARTERAIIAIEEGRLADAERELREVIATTDAALVSYENLALVLERQGRLAEATLVLREARDKERLLRARTTANLAVLLYHAGRKEEALAELESVRAIAARENDAGGRRALFLLGRLYAEMGRDADAALAFREFLAATAALHDEETLAMRRAATSAAAALGQ